MRFADRTDAGRRLGAALRPILRGDCLVVGLPRGGVEVAVEVARALGVPLDVLVVRKLGVPGRPELAMGAVGEGGIRVLDDRVIRGARVTPEQLEEVERRERAEVDRRSHAYRARRPPLAPAGRTVVLVDDGLATGSTARAGCRLARAAGAGQVVVAVPVASRRALAAVRPDADHVVSLVVPADFAAVGQYYGDFAQVPDERVLELLAGGTGRGD